MKHIFPFVWLLFCGCPAVDAIADGGPADAGDDGYFVQAPLPPAEPLPPVMTPCPTGWRAIADPSMCEPWPEGGRQTCTGDTAHFVGEPGCARIGPACPSDGWPDNLPSGKAVVFVRAGATGGNGSKAAPFGSLGTALTNGGGGKLIALATGIYSTPVAIPANTVLWGACVGQTTLTLGTQPAVLLSRSPGVAAHQLRITGDGPGIGAVGNTASVQLQNVLIENVATAGMLVQMGARVTGQNVVIRDIKPYSNGSLGDGINASDAAQVDLERVVVERSHNAAVFTYGQGAQVHITQGALLDTQPSASDGKHGYGVWSNTGSMVLLADTAVENNRNAGVMAISNSTVQVTGVVVRSTQPDAAGRGDGLWSTGGATITGQRVRFEHNANTAFGVNEAGSVLNLTDVIVRDSIGIGAHLSGQLTIERALLQDSNNIYVLGKGTRAKLTDVRVRNDSGIQLGPGLVIGREADCEANRVHIEHTAGPTVVVSQASLRASDLAIHETLTDSAQTGGWGIALVSGATATLERVLVANAFTAGVLISAPMTSLTVSDLDISDVLPPPLEGGLYGNGMVIADATVSGSRIRIRRTTDVAVLVDSTSAQRVGFRSLSIRDTHFTCMGRLECKGRLATGLSVVGASQVQVNGFSISYGGIGIEVAESAGLDLRDGDISHHQVGANVITPGYDVERLSQGVTYRDNTTQLTSLDVPLPKVAPPPKWIPDEP